MYKNLLFIRCSQGKTAIQYNEVMICDSILRFPAVFAIFAIVIIQTEKCKTSNQFGEKCEPMTIIFFIIDWCVHSAVKTRAISLNFPLHFVEFHTDADGFRCSPNICLCKLYPRIMLALLIIGDD